MVDGGVIGQKVQYDHLRNYRNVMQSFLVDHQNSVANILVWGSLVNLYQHYLREGLNV
jgi:hypothetical protein